MQNKNINILFIILFKCNLKEVTEEYLYLYKRNILKSRFQINNKCDNLNSKNRRSKMYPCEAVMYNFYIFLIYE